MLCESCTREMLRPTMVVDVPHARLGSDDMGQQLGHIRKEQNIYGNGCVGYYFPRC